MTCTQCGHPTDRHGPNGCMVRTPMSDKLCPCMRKTGTEPVDQTHHVTVEPTCVCGHSHARHATGGCSVRVATGGDCWCKAYRPVQIAETQDAMRMKPYSGPFLQIEATIGMGGDGALRIAQAIRDTLLLLSEPRPDPANHDSMARYAEVVGRAATEADELERIGHLAKKRELREGV